jgi:diguanylate cyclase (GGDEF)-like protein
MWGSGEPRTAARATSQTNTRRRSPSSASLLSRWEVGFLIVGWLVLTGLVLRAVFVLAASSPAYWLLALLYAAAVTGASMFRIRLGTRTGVPLVGASVALLVVTVLAETPFAAAGVYGVGLFFGYLHLLRRPALAAYAAAVGAVGAFAFVSVQTWIESAGVPTLAAYPVSTAVYVAVILLIEFGRQRGHWSTTGTFGVSAVRPLRLVAVWGLVTGLSMLLEAMHSALTAADALPGEAEFGALIVVWVGALLVVLALLRDLRIVTARHDRLVEAARRLPWDDVEDHEAYLVDIARRAVQADHALLGDRPPEGTEIGAEVLDADGTARWLIASRPLNATAFVDGDRHALDALAHIGSEVERARADMSRLERRARTDSLTGLPNYRAFHEALDRANEARARGTAIAVLYLDLDDFKELNDRHGHPFADQVLKAVVERVVEAVRTDDFVARLGGDEFAVILAPLDSIEQAQRIAERIIDHTGKLVSFDGITVLPRLSVGLAYSAHREDDASRIVDDADRIMLAVKQAAKVETTMPRRAGNLGVSSHRSSRFNDLVAETIASGDFALAYQPIVSLVADQIWAFEALLRVNDASGIRIPPEIFVERAKQIGMFNELTREIVRRALEAGRRFSGITPSVACVTVNIEAVQMLPDELGGFLAEIVTEYPDVRLCLELNERSVAFVSDELREQTEILRDCGIMVALDDYGSESSSVAALVRVPMDILKIDRVLSDDLADAAHVAVLRTLQEFGDMLDYSIVVEGVENVQSASVLRSIGVRSAQGWYYGVPMTADATSERLQRHGTLAVLGAAELQALVALQQFTGAPA